MRAKGSGFIAAGLLLIALAFGLTGYNLYDSARAGLSAETALMQLDALQPSPQTDAENADALILAETEQPENLLTPDMEMPVKAIDGVDYIGILRIPALELQLPIAAQWSYSTLNTAPCRYVGTAYKDGFVICAHNYDAHFGRIKQLREGDTVTFIDVDGNEYNYVATALETLLPTAVDEMTSTDWALTLFTCTIGGQYRVTLRCDRE